MGGWARGAVAVLFAAGMAAGAPAPSSAAQAQGASQGRPSPAAPARPNVRPAPKATQPVRPSNPSPSRSNSPVRPDLRPDPRPDPYPKPQPPRPSSQAPRAVPPDQPSPVVLQPPQRSWGAGGPVAAGAALGSLQPGLATAVAGPAPANGMCWYYKTPDRRVGFWDKCTP